MPTFIDLTGQIFGKLTVVSLVSRSSRSTPKVLWLCQCSCGRQKIAQGGLLRRGAVRSCGCTYQLKTPLELRFWEMVDRNGPIPLHCPELGQCWIWVGSKGKAGYGQINSGDGNSTPILATRFSYELANGPDSLGEKFACHKCDNPPCVNPAHLFAGTNQENVTDMVSKSRNRRGEKHGSAKLTEQNVREIRRQAASGVSQREIATQFGIDATNVSHIVRKKTWTAVNEEINA